MDTTYLQRYLTVYKITIACIQPLYLVEFSVTLCINRYRVDSSRYIERN